MILSQKDKNFWKQSNQNKVLEVLLLVKCQKLQKQEIVILN